MASSGCGNEMSYQQREAHMMEMLKPVMDCPSTILGSTTLRSISMLLDPDNGICAGWEKLAELMAFTNGEINKLKQCRYQAAEVIKSAALKHMFTMRQLIDIVHNRLGRRDIFTNEQIVKETLMDAHRHYRTGVRRSFSLPISYLPVTLPPPAPPLSAQRFQGLNSDSFLPSYRHSEFTNMNSNLYTDSMLYSPGSHLKSGRMTPPLESVAPKGSPVENETGVRYTHHRAAGTTPKQEGLKTTPPSYASVAGSPTPLAVYGQTGYSFRRNREWIPGYSFDNPGALEFAPRYW